MPSSMVKNINKVIEKTRLNYNDIMQSPYVGKDVMIDGYKSKGQIEDNKRATTLKQEQSKQMTCLLDAPVHRGAYVEIKSDSDKDEYDLKGIILGTPSKTPVDWYFTCLLFNTTVERYRKQLIYDDNGDIVGNNPLIVDKIPCFVQRVGMRERQIDAGIDRNSVNEMIACNKWDIKKNDILHIGSDRYKVTDIDELDNDVFNAYMTYYRE